MGSATLDGNLLPFTVSASCPNGHLVDIAVTASWSGGSISYPVSFMVGSPSQVFADNFSLGTGNWTLAGGPWGTSATAHSAPLALTDSPSGQYANNLFATATLNGTYYATTLTFWQRYTVESNYDFCKVEVSANGGAWNTLSSVTGSNTTWHQVTVSLAAYAGQPLRIRFTLTTYGFRVYSDALLTQVAASADGVVEGSGQTSWDANGLAGGVYWWRAYAADPELWGSLGEARSFTVSTSTPVEGAVVLGPRLAVLGAGGGQARLQLTLGQALTGRLTMVR